VRFLKPLVSVIVPVFKVEDCLVRCLESLCGQSLRDIEIILIDDASPDRCGAICEEYSSKDARIKVIHHSENKGLSATRNTGLKEASADYLMFVDSDDYVHEDFCKLPYECAVRYQADLVLFRFKKAGQPKLIGGQFYKNIASSAASGYRTQVEALDLLQGEIEQYAWNKLYVRHLFDGVTYPEGYLFEDMGTTYKTILKASRIYYLNKVLYYHCYRTDSISMSKSQKALTDLHTLYKQQYRDLAAWGYPPEKLDRLLKNIALTYCARKRKDAFDTDYAFYEKLLRSSKQIPEGFTWERKILFELFRYCPPLFEWVCNAWGKKHEA
jgi:Glycosyltransferases involved in cell wall biogenesis